MVNRIFFLTQINLKYLKNGNPLYDDQEEVIIHLSSDCFLLNQTSEPIHSIELKVTLKELHEGFIHNGLRIRCCVDCFGKKHRPYLLGILETSEQEKARKEKELHRMAYLSLGLTVPPEYQ